MKDLNDVQPRTVLRNDFVTITPIVIPEPGSYLLGEDIQAIPSQHGIEIASNDITLDLNGFTIRGNQEVGSLDGIHIDGARVNISIKNGNVRDFFGMGVNGAEADNCRIRDVRAYNNGGLGIRVRFNAVVTGCSAWGNGQAGLATSHNSVVRGCNAYENGDTGISGGVNVAVTDCAAWENGGDGFASGNGSAYTNCIARGNGDHGFDNPQRCVFMNCASVNNGRHGFRATNANSYLNCSAAQNAGDGFNVSNSLIRGCIANSNTGVNYQAVGGSTLLENHT
jgi:hypothetical protein